jgi:hypothetical protein
MVSYSDYFQFLNTNGSIPVTVLYTEQSLDCKYPFGDLMTVDYLDRGYTLTWNDFGNYYKGKINKKEGYVY